MEYTSYGLLEGLGMVGGAILMLTVMYLIVLVTSSKQSRKITTILYGLALTCVVLDTLMWVFSIQTNVIDRLVGEVGSQEQVTIFGVALPFLIVGMMISGKSMEYLALVREQKELEE